MNIRKSLASVGAALAVTIAILGVASPASAAAARDGVCDSGEFCYYYNSDLAGSVSDFTESVEDYGTTQPTCYDFKGEGNGKGVCVKNNAASVWNRTDKTVVVYFNSGFAGASQSFAAGAKGNLNATLKNNNASHSIGAISTYPDDPRAASAVAFAKARLEHTDWNNQCELFVERAFGTSGQFATAATHYNWQKDNGRMHTGSVPPAGTAVFFTSTTSAGHIMLSIGGNSAISTGTTVYQTDTFRQRSDYLGWAYVPSSW